jgi:cardiolipin synthase
MAALLEKIRSYRRRRAGRPPRTQAQRRETRWSWWMIALGVCLVFGGYFWMTSARLLKEPIRLDYGPLDAHFASAMGPLTGAEFTDGNSVQVLVNGDEFFPVMLKAIAQAKHTINLETYIWESGYISNEFIAARCERARTA